MSAWNPKSKLSTFIAHQSKLLRDPDPAERAKAHEVSRWLDSHSAFDLLVNALTRCAPVKAIKGVDDLPNLWLSPPPAGQGHHAAVVIGVPEKGPARCVASNEIVQPDKEPNASCPKNFFQLFDTSKLTADQTQLIQQAVNTACADQMELVEKACTECQTFRTMAVFIVVLTADKPLLFVTTLMATSPQQKNLKQAFTGKVAP